MSSFKPQVPSSKPALASLLTNHPVRGLLTLAVLVWYSTITIYIGIRGLIDIKQMLRSLKENHGKADGKKK